MALIVIEFNGEEDIIVIDERKDDGKTPRKPGPGDIERYLPQPELVPVTHNG